MKSHVFGAACWETHPRVSTHTSVRAHAHGLLSGDVPGTETPLRREFASQPWLCCVRWRSTGMRLTTAACLMLAYCISPLCPEVETTG